MSINNSQPTRERYWLQIGAKFWRAISAPPFMHWTTGRRAVSALNISAPFHIFFYFSSYEEDAMKQAIS